MIKHELKKLDLTLFEETLDNGLKVFVVPKNNVKNCYVTFSTKYGSDDNEFVPLGSKNYIKVPDGVAHFLEHKLFEQEKGLAPFDFYSKSGADCNANTSHNKTTYLFVGQEKIKENLNYLLDFVSEPYFTDENVLKEKGIIEQEIKMYQDDPDSYGVEKLLYNTFNTHPIKIPISGTIDSINKITKEDLYTCYSTFYHPANMFLVVTGNVNPEEIINIVKENQKNKKYEKYKKIKIKNIKEEDKVFKKNEVLNMNVTIPKLLIAYKINIKDIKLDDRTIATFSNNFLRIMFGSTSLFELNLVKEKIISRDLEYWSIKTNDHLVFVIEAYTNKRRVLLNKINEYISSNKITEQEFKREKKVMLSSSIYMSDNIYRINNYLMNNIVNYKKFEYNSYNFYKKLSYHDFDKFIKNLIFDNYSTVYIKNS